MYVRLFRFAEVSTFDSTSHLCRFVETFFSPGCFCLVPVVKNKGGMLRRVELMRGLVGSQSWSYWAAHVPGWEEIEDHEIPLISCSALCPSLTGTK